MPKIYYCSDLHIDYNIKYSYFQKDIDPGSYLVLAGDICGYHFPDIFISFFQAIQSKFKHIIYITGNHEYYKELLDDQPIRDLFKQIAAPNIHFLQNEFIEFPDDKLIFYGSTFWTAGTGDMYQDKSVEYSLNDYNQIYVIHSKMKFKITRHELINLHEAMKKQLYTFFDHLQEDKDKYDGYRKIIVTHHLPIYELIDPKYQYYDGNSGFASKLLPELLEKDFDYWICGHTHSSNKKNFTLANGKVAQFLINPKGYDLENPKFQEYEFLEIE